jgi:hypothetical protein
LELAKEPDGSVLQSPPGSVDAQNPGETAPGVFAPGFAAAAAVAAASSVSSSVGNGYQHSSIEKPGIGPRVTPSQCSQPMLQPFLRAAATHTWGE